MAADLQYTSVFQKVSFGDYGFRILTSGETSLANETFAAIQVLVETVLALTNNVEGGDTMITNLSLDAGQIIYGNFSAITLSSAVGLSSGKVIAYLR
jgi:hypothetical protein